MSFLARASKWLAFALLLLGMGFAKAMPVAQWPGASLRVAQGLASDLSVEDVARLPEGRFQAHEPRQSYRISVESPLWLHLQLPASSLSVPEPQLVLPNLLVDRYELYQRDASGAWQMRAAGDRVPHVQWPIDSLYPRFQLQSTSSGGKEVYIRVVHQLPSSLQPQLLSANEAFKQDGLQMLWTGLLAGVVFTLVLACAQMWLAYRDLTYAWYALYLLGTLLAALSYSGVAQSWFWPEASKLASDAVVYGVMLALAFNLQFSRAMFGSLQGRAYHITVHVLFALCFGYMWLTFFALRYDRTIWAFTAICGAVFVFILYSALSAWRKGVHFARYWLMVYAPFLLSIALTLANSIGMIALPWLPVATPALAAVIEAVAMMLCINAYSRLRHAQVVQQQVSKQYDPLTGFLNASHFRAQATALWKAAASQRREVAVAYMTVEPAAGSSIDSEALMARSVRLVRSVAREFDVVGRLSRDRLGLLMPDLPQGDALAGRLARLVALGLMHDDPISRESTIRFRISVGMRKQFAGSFTQLDEALQALLRQESASAKPIDYLPDAVQHHYPK